MSKRAAEKQLTKDDPDYENDAPANPEGGFKRAPPEVLKKRRILKARRRTATPLTTAAVPAQPTGAAPESDAATADKPKNPFANVPAVEKPKNPFENLPPVEKPKNPFANIPPIEPTNISGKIDEQPPKADAGNKDDAAPASAVEPKSAVEGKKPEDSQGGAEKPDVKKSDAVEKIDVKEGDAGEKRDAKESDAGGEHDVKEGDVKEGDVKDGDAGEKRDVKVDKASKLESEEDKKPVSDAAATDKQAEPVEAIAKEAATKPATKPAVADDANALEAKAKANDAAPADAKAESSDAKPADAKPLAKPFVFGGASGGTTSFAAAATATNGGAFNFAKSVASGVTPALETSFAGVSKTGPKAGYVETKVSSGEEGETTAHRVRAKAFALENNAWRERGVGALKLNVEQSGKAARLLLRNEATLRLALNAPLYRGFRMDRASDKAVRFKDVASGTLFLCRLPTKDDAEKIIGEVELQAKKLPEIK